MLSAESFRTYNLRAAKEGDSITRILAASIRAIEPGKAVESVLSLFGDILSVARHEYDLAKFEHVRLVGIGKASLGMSAALARLLGAHLDAGLIITKHAKTIPEFPFTILEGGHPVPNVQSLEAGGKLLDFLASLGPHDLLFCLVSGGGSALVATPVENLRLEDLQALTSALLASGARIDEINTLRRRLERLKGGGMVRFSNGATIVSLILSDVVGNSLEAIASGPTAPDPTSRSDALAVLDKYRLRGIIPASIPTALELSLETPKPGDPLFDKVQNVIVGSSLMATQAALAQAEIEGFHPHLLRVDLQGEASQAGSDLAKFLLQVKRTGFPIPAPACIIAAGETIVTIKGNGKGGRNTELALAAVPELAEIPGVMLISLATDGEDGLTDAAGAVVTGKTFNRAAALGLNPQDFLNRNDSYTFFSAQDDLLKPGPTGTNCNDLVFLFVL
jgi:glycerate 2-kinase